MVLYKSLKSTKQIQAERLVKLLHSIDYLTSILSSDDTTFFISLLSIFGTITSSLLIRLVGTFSGYVLKVCSAVIIKLFC